jgi:soluble lytic murein transglycosylase
MPWACSEPPKGPLAETAIRACRRARPQDAVAGGPIKARSPASHAALGSRYLRGLLDQWGGDPLAAVASYNAGPGAVAGWEPQRSLREPELWVEAIPYPETRLYVKKVLGNAWSYQRPRHPDC